MDTESLIEQCLKAIGQQRHTKSPGVVLGVATSKIPPGFPRGKVLCESKMEEKRVRTKLFPALRVLAWAVERRATVQHQEGASDE